MDNFHITAAVSPIPEPETSIMFIAGSGLMGFLTAAGRLRLDPENLSVSAVAEKLLPD
ncbi:putative secreted protein with PEP-CTERM sorting signal [Nitrosospira sp. Nsp2]|uniref:PEP-CTERM sorting domain-containing protein n=1 Tax=Nitrosospira sp. Nsp2 TaxID=136548 RepID=UPI000D2F7406|nr:putative secreted protein with PEP-CTERM sorting signal [Nitrosospira sp. Nsp2]